MCRRITAISKQFAFSVRKQTSGKRKHILFQTFITKYAKQVTGIPHTAFKDNTNEIILIIHSDNKVGVAIAAASVVKEVGLHVECFKNIMVVS